MSKGILSTANIKGKTYFNSFANDEFPVVEQVSDTKQIGHGDGYVSDGIVPEISTIDELKLMGNTVQNLVPSEPTPTEEFTQYEEASFVQTSSDTNIKMGSGELKQAIVEGNTYKNLANKLSNPTEVISVEKSVQSIYPNTFTDQYQHILDDAEFASAELEGKTLVNLQQKGTTWNINGTVEMPNANASYRSDEGFPLSKLKPNTKYLIKFSKDISEIYGTFYFIQGTKTTWTIQKGGWGIVTTLSTLTSANTGIHVYPKVNSIVTVESLQDVHVMIIEYQEGMENWDIPYFEGMKSVETIKVTTYNSPVQFGKGGRL